MRAIVFAVDGLLAVLLIVSVVMVVRASSSRDTVRVDLLRGWAALCASLGACLSITAWLLHAPTLVALPLQLLTVALFITTVVLLRRVASNA